MLGEAQGSHQNYTVKRLFEKDRNSREIKTKRSTRTGTLNKTYIQKRPANQVIVLSV